MSAQDFTVREVTSPEEFIEWQGVEDAAFAGSPIRALWFPGQSPADLRAFQAKVQEDIWRNDRSAVYLTAKSQSGKIIGIAKWNFFVNAGPHHPWPTTFPPNANENMINEFFGDLDNARNSALSGKRHALMAILGIHPEYQRMGVGGSLLEWGFEEV